MRPFDTIGIVLVDFLRLERGPVNEQAIRVCDNPSDPTVGRCQYDIGLKQIDGILSFHPTWSMWTLLPHHMLTREFRSEMALQSTVCETAGGNDVSQQTSDIMLKHLYTSITPSNALNPLSHYARGSPLFWWESWPCPSLLLQWVLSSYIILSWSRRQANRTQVQS